MQLTTAQFVKKGNYFVNYYMTSGTAKLQMTKDGQAAQDITDTSKSAADNFLVELPDCQIQPVLTGDATSFISQIDGDPDGLFGNK